MSSPSDDPTIQSGPPNASQEREPTARISLEDGVLDRYLLGTLRPDEVGRAKEFFADSRRARVIDWLREWVERDVDAAAPRADQTLGQLWQQIRDHDTLDQNIDHKSAQTARRDFPNHALSGQVENVLGKQTRRMPSWGMQTLRRWVYTGIVTAGIALVFLSGWLHGPADLGVTRTYTTSTGQRATVTLDDGTRVTLAPQTTLHLTHFGARSRTVTLDGEAYFENAHTMATPFIVRSGPVATQVLGTTFLVRHYLGDARARVFVTAGKVNVSSLTARFIPVVLTEGRTGEISDSTITVHTGDDVASETGWLQGRLFFRHTPVPELLATLNRWYGYQFRCADPALLQENVTVIVSTQSPTAALAILEQVLGVNLTVVGDTVTLTPHAARPVQGKVRMQTYDVWTPSKEAGR